MQGSNFTDVFNMGHLLTGDYGEEKVGDVWTAIGGPGNPNIAGLPLYGTRHQFDRYSVNMALTDRNIITGASGTSGIRDAIMFWDASPANNSRMYIGKTLGQGRISPDIVINPNGNVGIGTDAPISKLDIRGELRASVGIFGRIGFTSQVGDPPGPKLEVSGTSAGDLEPLVNFSDSRSSSGSSPNFVLSMGGTFNRELLLGTTSSSGVIASTDGNLQLGSITSGAFDRAISIGRNVITFDNSLIILGGISSTVSPTSSILDFGTSSRPWDDIFADNFINVSDQREKDQIKELSYGLDHLMKLKPVSYKWKKQPEKGMKHGLIAQEVQKVLPEVVYDPEKDIDYDESGKALPVDPEARMGIAYSELIPLLIKSIQELNTKVQEQEKIIADLTDENGRTSADELEESLDSPGSSSKLELLQNTPNPFDQSTTIRYYLPEGTEKAQLFIYNIDGQQVRSMELTKTGEGAMTITAGELGAGIYFYTLYADGEVSQTRKMILTE